MSLPASNEFQTVVHNTEGGVEIITITGDFPWARILEIDSNHRKTAGRPSKSRSQYTGIYVTFNNERYQIRDLQSAILDMIETNPEGITWSDLEKSLHPLYNRETIKTEVSAVRGILNRNNRELLVGRISAPPWEKNPTGIYRLTYKRQ